MLPRPHRLTLGADYRQVVRRGVRCGGPRMVVSMLRTSDAQATRFGFIISKQVGTAVVRNTIRRRLKAICAELRPEVPQGTDIVIRALPASVEASFDQLRADVERCLRRGKPVR